MQIKMELISDAIFGNGMSIPGAEDISVLCDEYGFPYYRGSTFKGIVREEYERYFQWLGKSKNEIIAEVSRLFGDNGDDIGKDKLIFSDFVISDYVKKTILDEYKKGNPDLSLWDIKNIYAENILDLFSNVRTFTKISDQGIAQNGTLRMARCINQGLYFYSEIRCNQEDEMVLREVIGSIKWLGSMRNRGFGKVKLTIEEDA